VARELAKAGQRPHGVVIIVKNSDLHYAKSPTGIPYPD
jgi:hypothetical protein